MSLEVYVQSVSISGPERICLQTISSGPGCEEHPHIFGPSWVDMDVVITCPTGQVSEEDITRVRAMVGKRLVPADETVPPPDTSWVQTAEVREEARRRTLVPWWRPW